MTSSEYIQLKAFARQEGFFLGVLWSVAFLFVALNLSQGYISSIGVLLMTSWPFFLGWRLKSFRDYARDGEISFLRSWAFCLLCTFYAAIVTAAVEYIYFAYFDHGSFLNQYEMIMNAEPNKEAIRQMGMQKDLDIAFAEMRKLSPADMVYEFLSMYLSGGIFFGAIIALFMRRKKK